MNILFRKELIFKNISLASLVLLSSFFAGCASSSTNSGASGGNAVIKIATQSPLSGPESLEGEAIKLGAQLAVQDRAEDFKKMGFDLVLFPQDDQADPKIGVSNAEMLISDPDVLAVVGHYNTGVAVPSSTKYEEGKLAMVSPANTGVELTEEGKKTVNRLVARNDQIAPGAAKYAKEKMGVNTVFIIHDKTAYGQGLADEAKKAFENLGTKVVGFEGVTRGEKDYSAVVNLTVASAPDLVFFGGNYPEGGLIAKQLKEKGYKGRFMGGEGLDSKDIFKIAGDATQGMVFATAVGDIRASEEGKKWVERYKSTFNKDPGAFSAFAYDAALTVLNGIEKAIKENQNQKPTREQVMNAIRSTTDFQGQFVKVSFDEKGDNKYAQVYLYEYKGEEAKFVGVAE